MGFRPIVLNNLMNLKKRALSLLGVSALLLTTALPSSANTGEVELLQTMHDLGVTIVANTSGCKPKVDGMFNISTNTLTLCNYSGSPDSNDRDTVRHEAWHFLQSCAVKRHTYPGMQTFNTTAANFAKFVSMMSPAKIANIKENYSSDVHAVELEAFAAAEAYPASYIAKLIRQHCS